MLDLDRLEEELRACSIDAGLAPGSFAVFVVEAERPPGTTPMAYLQPAGHVWPDTVHVFRAAGAETVGRLHLSAHRLALWRDLGDLPAAALGPMLRHEVEHARRWERSGTAFFEADDLLRASVREAGGHGYSALPSELEANQASAAYAVRTLTEAQLGELRAAAECAALITGGAAPDDIVEATLAELARRDGWAPWFEDGQRADYLQEVRRACAAWSPDAARAIVAGGDEPTVELIQRAD